MLIVWGRTENMESWRMLESHGGPVAFQIEDYVLQSAPISLINILLWA